MPLLADMYFAVSEFASQLQKRRHKAGRSEVQHQHNKLLQPCGTLPSFACACVKWGEMPVWGQEG